MRAFGPVLLSVLALAGCGKQAQVPQPRRADAPAAPAVPAAPPPAQARKVHVETPLFEFDFAYPAAAAAILALKAALDADLAQARATIESEAKAGEAEARQNRFPFVAYSSGTDWQVVAELPGWLSMSAQVYDYLGGAHPNHGYSALLWDKSAGRKRAVAELFTSKAALSRAIRAPFCDALDRQRAERRGAPVDRAGGDEFDACIDPAGSTVILGSSNHRTFDRIGVLVGPYEAGPYVEGDYEVTLPVTPAVMAAVRPEYRAAFSVKR
ncbi:MAG: DUF4163 domain-containing protein [Sphingomonadales bacterium]|nr:DUF4163 domain-containing protein [Sphingomonadales bacterium]